MTTPQQPVPGTFYPRSAFGTTNPNAGRPPNGDRNAWGGYAWPAGVPTSKLGTATWQSRSSGQQIRVQVRAELVELWSLVLQIMDQVHGYAVWANVNGENWGPWGYANRAVAGSNTPSGHSMALSVDFNAPWNPMSSTWQTNMPPAMVADLESLGLFWGGRYTGQTDTMHYGYCFPPSSVAGHVARARQILAGAGGNNGPTPPTPTPPTPAPDLLEWIMSMPGAPANLTWDQFLDAIMNRVWERTTPRHSVWQDNQVTAVEGRRALDTITGAETNTAELRRG